MYGPNLIKKVSKIFGTGGGIDYSILRPYWGPGISIGRLKRLSISKDCVIEGKSQFYVTIDESYTA